MLPPRLVLGPKDLIFCMLTLLAAEAAEREAMYCAHRGTSDQEERVRQMCSAPDRGQVPGAILAEPHEICL